ncbi:MAG: hypothetical protein FWG80_00545 [Alphaproteobacteria bacterium]|nr:hypothetical protein [Alphaproteobacteria bacterium]
MANIRNCFRKAMREYLALCLPFIISCSLFISVTPRVHADDYDFEFDSFTDDSYSDDAFLDGAIEDSGDLEFNTTGPLFLNENTSFADVIRMDIAGVWLGMPFQEVHTLFFRKGSLYAPRKHNSIVYTMSKDWKYNLDYECRQQNIVAPTLLANCVNSFAKKRGLLYASELHLARESTGETIVVYFTSNASDNVVWRVIYQNDADVIEGDAEKFADQRDKKILAFWQGVLDKYGAPNSGDDKWISSDNAFDPMMTAFYGRLELADEGLRARDAALNFQSARENFRAKPYSF